jgi:hypothetical protein
MSMISLHALCTPKLPIPFIAMNRCLYLNPTFCLSEEECLRPWSLARPKVGRSFSWSLHRGPPRKQGRGRASYLCRLAQRGRWTTGKLGSSPSKTDLLHKRGAFGWHLWAVASARYTSASEGRARAASPPSFGGTP